MIKIVIGDIPPSLNQLNTMHWAERRRIKEQFAHDVYYSAYNKRPSKPFKKARVRITYYFNNKHRHDADNYNPKMLLDPLVKVGILIDDNYDVIGQPDIVMGYDKYSRRVEIEIWEVE